MHIPHTHHNLPTHGQGMSGLVPGSMVRSTTSRQLQRGGIPRSTEGSRVADSAGPIEHRAGTSEHRTASKPSPQVPPFEPPHLGSRPIQTRPLFPIVNPQEVIDSVFGTNLSGKVNNYMPPFLEGLQNLDRSGPLIYKPHVQNEPPESVTAQLPLMLYIPGVDGTGLAAYRQFPALSRFFDLHAVYMPPEDRSNFEQIVETVKAQLESKLAGGDPMRPVYLLGESFGGLVSLELARRMGNAIDRIVLSNPATSFANSPWPQAGPLLASLPERIYNMLPLAISPLVSNPVSLAMNNVNPKAPQADFVSQFAWALVDLLPELGSMRSVLPPATLAHRLNLLKEAATYVNPRVDQVPQRTLLLVGSDDRVIPSATEGPRLKFRMARCRLEVLEGRSHAMLQEAGVDIMAIMSDTGFYMPKRKLTSAYQTKDSKGGRRSRGGNNGNKLSSSNGTGGVTSTNGSGPHQNGSTNGTTLAATAAAAQSNGWKGSASENNGSSTSREVPMGGSANFGKPLPVEVPTPKEIEFTCQEGGIVSVANLDRLVSPVFFSTDAETGQVMYGLGGVPTGEGRPGGRPVLFIGNHQPPAPDMFLVVVQFLKEKGVLLRGLAHPAVFMGTTELLQQSMKEDEENRYSNSSNMGPGAFLSSLMNNLTGRGGGPMTPEQQQEQIAEERQTANFFSTFLTTFGAVPVSGFSLYNLLSQGETCFMFPGGAREALKRKDERYTLIWPERSEFVRMAARFGATIVPFGAVGAEDAFNQILDGDDMLQMPVVGDFFRSQSSRVPQARKGVSANDVNRDVFAQPIVTFNAPSRFYYTFGRPITTSPEMANNRVECDKLYQEVRDGVDGCLSWMLRNRERDPYKDTVQRVAYEAAWGGTRKAPTFSLPDETQKEEELLRQQEEQEEGVQEQREVLKLEGDTLLEVPKQEVRQLEEQPL